jgi:signal transduction histidine kinase
MVAEAENWRRVLSRSLAGRALAGRGLLWAVLAIGVIVALISYEAARAADDARVRSILELRTEWRARDLEAKIRAAVTPVEALAVFVASQGVPEGDRFRRFAHWSHAKDDPIRALLWVPRVLDRERAGVEAQAKSDGIPDYEIRELTLAGDLIAAARHEEYFPVRLEERFEDQASLLGFDLTQVEERRLAAFQARDGGEAVATAPIAHALRTSTSTPYYEVFWPVYAGNAVPTTTGDRRAALLGFAVGNYRIQAVLAAATRDTPEILETIDFYIDGAADGDVKPVATYRPDLAAIVVDGTAPASSGRALTRSFDVLGRHWTAVSHFAPEIEANLHSFGPQASLVAGFLLTVAIGAYVGRERIRRLAVEAVVAERTADLKDANTALRNEAAERQRMLQQLIQAQKMEAIGNLTGGMAHDFNNLLGVIIGNLDLLIEQRGGDPEVAELSREALDAATRGAELTRGLLAFARRQPLRPKRIDVNDLVANITRLLRRTLGERVEIALDLAPDLWAVLADPAQLEAALANLATNARDAMADGGRLRVATRNRTLDADYAAEHPEVVAGDYIEIEVSDTGAGIPRELLGRIFEPFFTTKDHGSGSGLGLSMVFGYLKQSGGHVSVYSEVGVGSTFRLYLPRLRDETERPARPATATTSRGQGERVLVVEDNPALRRVAVRQVTELGYCAREAENAAAAIALLEGGSAIDLLFTDIVMPGEMDGGALARAVCARWPEIKVILTSGFPGAKIDEARGIPAGTRLLGKPYRKDELARVLRDVLDERDGAARGGADGINGKGAGDGNDIGH